MKFQEALIFEYAAKVSPLFTALLNRTNGKLVSGGVKRTYLLHIPRSYDPSTPTALVLSLHGYMEWPAHQAQISHWNRLADRHGFIVVYPCGAQQPLRWAFGRTADDPALLRDVGFISNLIDKLEGDTNIDRRRIYVNGLSNGGGMSFALAGTLSGRIAAFGSVAGAYTLPWSEYHPARPVPAIIFHGTADPIVPFTGGPSGSLKIPFPALREWVSELAQRNGCLAVPVKLPAVGKAEGSLYENSSSGAEVVFYTILEGGHSWPGGGSLPQFIAGTTNQDVDATALMWDFFQSHPMR
jgi:polyhydroxybutyrate depolymerase